MTRKPKKNGSPRNHEDAPYEVGFGKPPDRTKFKPGQSGNPKGRSKGSRNFSTDVREALKAKVRVRDGEGSRKTSTQEAALMRLREKALKGDARSLERLLELAATYNNDPEAVAVEDVSETDREILEALLSRRSRPKGVIRSAIGAANEQPAAGHDDTAKTGSDPDDPDIEEILR
ncbi:DUF5681 domain-containing protein [Microbaculum sp. FT89]|uniref:DUF5681 domain-containing protein n=1 Tax=Microbaculum sp. FT89 TaxID=3447298 RepID=UPI003F52D3BF